MPSPAARNGHSPGQPLRRVPHWRGLWTEPRPPWRSLVPCGWGCDDVLPFARRAARLAYSAGSSGSAPSVAVISVSATWASSVGSGSGIGVLPGSRRMPHGPSPVQRKRSALCRCRHLTVSHGRVTRTAGLSALGSYSRWRSTSQPPCGGQVTPAVDREVVGAPWPDVTSSEVDEPGSWRRPKAR
jgi:hypothetical protein